MANRTYTVIITRQGTSENNTEIEFGSRTISGTTVEYPAYYVNGSTKRLTTNFELKDKTTQEAIVDNITRIVTKLYDGNGLLMCTSDGTPTYYEGSGWSIASWDNSPLSTLESMTEQEVEACKINIQFEYDGITNEFESNLNYYLIA
jgi:hypothetical protein